MKKYQSSGIVIKHSNWGEADKIMTFITPEGKHRLIAKGVRKISSKRRSTLELFNHVSFNAYQKSPLDTLIEVQLIPPYFLSRDNLLQVSLAFHFCELADKLTVDSLNAPEIYQILLKFLPLLSLQEPQLLARQFEIELLDVLGFGLPTPLTQKNLIDHIEKIIERPLKSRRILSRIFQ